MPWTTLRDLTTPQAAEGRTAPDPSLFAGLDPASSGFAQDGSRVPYLELSFDALTFGGGAAATAVTFGIWRTSDGRTDRVESVTVQAADAGSPQPVVVALQGEGLRVTVESFTGGTTPTIAGKVYGRPVRP